MSLIHDHLVSREILAQRFAKAVNTNNYLLLICESTQDMFCSDSDEQILEVTSPEDAFETLKSRYDKMRSYNGMLSIKTVFEPSKTYNECFDTHPLNSALGSAIQNFCKYRDECIEAAAKLKEEQESKKAKNWLQRALSL